MLQLGSSEVWNEAMFQMTGQRDMSTAPLQKYFKPLTEWLKEQNDANGDVRGWDTEMTWKPGKSIIKKIMEMVKSPHHSELQGFCVAMFSG